jgi:hypothetical protein
MARLTTVGMLRTVQAGQLERERDSCPCPDLRQLSRGAWARPGRSARIAYELRDSVQEDHGQRDVKTLGIARF